MRYRVKLTCFKSSEKNRYQNCLTVSNIQLASVVSDTFGKSSQKIPDKILENPNDTSFDIESLIHGSMKDKLPELKLAIDGYITPEQAAKLKIIKKHFDNLEARKAALEERILALASPYQQEISMILTAPGFKNTFTAIGIISEIGTNMEAFPSAKHLCSWAGLTPTSNESAGKKKSDILPTIHEITVEQAILMAQSRLPHQVSNGITCNFVYIFNFQNNHRKMALLQCD